MSLPSPTGDNPTSNQVDEKTSSRERLYGRRRRLRQLLRETTAGGPPCGVPGCPEPRVLEDCCYTHCLDQTALPHPPISNDGIIDWVAIDRTAQGEEGLSLSWIEQDIAAALALTRGVELYKLAIVKRTRRQRSSPRYKRIVAIAEAIRANGYGQAGVGEASHGG